jgi:hypothetical protein
MAQPLIDGGKPPETRRVICADEGKFSPSPSVCTISWMKLATDRVARSIERRRIPPLSLPVHAEWPHKQDHRLEVGRRAAYPLATDNHPWPPVHEAS